MALILMTSHMTYVFAMEGRSRISSESNLTTNRLLANSRPGSRVGFRLRHSKQCLLAQSLYFRAFSTTL